MALTLVLGSDEQHRHLEARGQGARWEKGDDLALHARDAGGVVTAQLGVLVQGCRVGRVRARDATPRLRRTRRGRRHGLADGHAHRRVERCRGDRPPTRCPVWIDPHRVSRLSGTYLRGKVRRVANKNSGERRLGATNAEQNRRERQRAEGQEDLPVDTDRGGGAHEAVIAGGDRRGARWTRLRRSGPAASCGDGVGAGEPGRRCGGACRGGRGRRR